MDGKDAPGGGYTASKSMEVGPGHGSKFILAGGGRAEWSADRFYPEGNEEPWEGLE